MEDLKANWEGTFGIPTGEDMTPEQIYEKVYKEDEGGLPDLPEAQTEQPFKSDITIQQPTGWEETGYGQPSPQQIEKWNAIVTLADRERAMNQYALDNISQSQPTGWEGTGYGGLADLPEGQDMSYWMNPENNPGIQHHMGSALYGNAQIAKPGDIIPSDFNVLNDSNYAAKYLVPPGYGTKPTGNKITIGDKTYSASEVVPRPSDWQTPTPEDFGKFYGAYNYFNRNNPGFNMIQPTGFEGTGYGQFSPQPAAPTNEIYPTTSIRPSYRNESDSLYDTINVDLYKNIGKN
jgi:hypothetical protein